MIKNFIDRSIAFAASDRGAATLLYCAGFGGLGLCLSILGPVLLGLAVQTESTLKETGYCFIIRSLGYLLGSTGGTLYDRIPGHYVFGGAMIGSAIGTALIPAVRSIVALGSVVIIQGISMGLTDTGGNVMMIWWFRQDVGPYMQAMHFAFALGAFIGPMLLRVVAMMAGGTNGFNPESGDAAAGEAARQIAPTGVYDAAFYIIAIFNAVIGGLLFIKPSPKPRKEAQHATPATVPEKDTIQLNVHDSLAHQENTTTATFTGSSQSGNITDELKAMDDGKLNIPNTTKTNSSSEVVEWGTIHDTNAASIVSATPTTTASTEDAPASATPAHEELVVPPNLTGNVWQVVAIVAALLFLYVGCETGFGAFVTSYAVVALGTSEAEGQIMTGVYWGAIMVGRFASIFVAMKFPPAKYLGVSMVACCVAAVFMLIFPNSIVTLWIGAVAYGIGMACVFPTAIALAETYFPVQGKHATAFVIGAATGEMLLPFIITTLFGGTVDPETGHAGRTQGDSGPGPIIMLWIVGVTTILNMLFYFLLVREGTKLHTKIVQSMKEHKEKHQTATLGEPAKTIQ